MVKEIRLYIEGDSRSCKPISLRQGFSDFFSTVVEKCRQNNIRWNVTLCNTRNSAFKDFNNAIRSHPEAFNILLVDSEEEVTETPWKHLKSRDNWEQPDNINDDNCHFMAQVMESWFIADVDNLKSFYGNGFLHNSIPRRQDVEKIPKQEVLSSLEHATAGTTKGKYHKTHHAPKLLQSLNYQVVRERAQHCNRLFDLLERKISEQG